MESIDDEISSQVKELNIKKLKKIGEGGQSDVYLGEWCNRLVAIKKLRNAVGGDWREVQHMRNIKHENIAQLLDFGIWKSSPAIVMEFCTRGSMASILRTDEKIRWRLWKKWLHDIVDGMCYLHENAIIHRDLKPDNILVTDGNVIRISDFGISREKLLSKPSRMTNVGTYCYMAPELIQGTPCTNKIDVWSFGVVLWSMLTRQEPYNDLQDQQVVYNVGANKVRLKIPYSVPKKFSLLMRNCWETEFEKRPTFADIRDTVANISAAGRMRETEWSVRARVSSEETANSTFTEDILTFEDDRMKRVYCIIVGDSNAGKTALLNAFKTDICQVDLKPKVDDMHVLTAVLDRQFYTLYIFDAKGDDDQYWRKLYLAHSYATVFLMCFSVVRPSSIHELSTKWSWYTAARCCETPTVLIGTKIDLREDERVLRKMSKYFQSV